MMRVSSAGFTMIEIASSLIILAVMAAILVPLASNLIDSTRANQTYDELGRIYTGIVGNPAQNNFGYLGDVGDYPSSLLDLVQLPASNPAGWNGPYINDARVDTGIMYDVFGGPLEYFNPTNLGNVTDQLAIISRGPDRGSTNTAANPNQRAGFTGTLPSNASYGSTIGNTDNIVYPRFTDNSGLLNYQDLATLAFNIMNFDQNNLVNANVPGCPGLYTITVTSVPRGSSDTFPMTYNPGGASVDLVQGLYKVRITSPLVTNSLWEDQVTMVPGQGVARTLNLSGIDSSATSTFTFTVVNNIGFTVTVLQNTTIVGTVLNGTTGTATVNGCSRITVENAVTNAIVDAFVYPYMAYTKRYNANPSFNLTVNNSGANSLLFVYDQALLVGVVGAKGNKKGKTFSNIRQGEAITIRDRNGVLLSSFNMPGANFSTTI